MNGIARLVEHVFRQRVLQDDDIAAQHVEGDAGQVGALEVDETDYSNVTMERSVM